MIIGALLGGIGSVLNTGMSIFRERQQIKADEKKRSDDFEMAKLNAERDTDVATTNADKDIRVASYEQDTAIGLGSQWVINGLRLVRPALTFYALGLVTLFWFTVLDDESKKLIVSSTLDLAAMATTWWFGERGFKK